jgi:hypothetical protein
MIRDFLISVFSFLVLEPMQAELNTALQAAKAPAAIIETAKTCLTDAAPKLADKAMADWWWATTTVVEVSIGMRAPETVLTDAAPSCGPAIQAVRPFLDGEGA